MKHHNVKNKKFSGFKQKHPYIQLSADRLRLRVEKNVTLCTLISLWSYIKGNKLTFDFSIISMHEIWGIECLSFYWGNIVNGHIVNKKSKSVCRKNKLKTNCKEVHAASIENFIYFNC